MVGRQATKQPHVAAVGSSGRGQEGAGDAGGRRDAVHAFELRCFMCGMMSVPGAAQWRCHRLIYSGLAGAFRSLASSTMPLVSFPCMLGCLQGCAAGGKPHCLRQLRWLLQQKAAAVGLEPPCQSLRCSISTFQALETI